MHFHRRIFGTMLVATATFLSACAMVAPSTAVRLGGTLAAANEGPPNASAGTGAVDATLDKASGKLSWKVTYSGVTGDVTAAHFHGPAMAGKNSGVVLGFKGSLTSPITGEAVLTPEQAADLLAGKWYVNLHTKANPSGEIRAQLLPL